MKTGIGTATPSTRLYARMALRSELSATGLDIGDEFVDKGYRGSVKILLINNSDTLLHKRQKEYF